MTITLTFNENSRTLQMPTSWNDLIEEDPEGNRNPKQAMTLLSILQGPGSLTDKRISIIVHLLALTPAEINEWQLDRAVEYGKEWQSVFFEEIDALLSATGFLLELQPGEDGNNGTQSERRFQLKPVLTKCPFPALRGMPSQFKGSSKTYDLYAPADNLENITAYELALLFDLYEQYTQTKDAALVDRLIATLYRKNKVETEEQLEENWYGDRRQPFNEHSVGIRQAQIAKLPGMVKNIIFFWFLSCRMSIVERYPGIFREADGQERSGPDYGWWGVFRQVGGSVLDAERIAHLNHAELLTELSFLDAQRLKAEMDRALAM